MDLYAGFVSTINVTLIYLLETRLTWGGVMM